ncbi:MAG: glycosyltransferase family 9 protein [Candidatus Hydrogenedentota bacterium]
MKILVIQTAFAGDLVLMLPFIYTLRFNFPDSRLDIIIKKGLSDLFKTVKEINNIFELDKKSISETIKLIKEIRLIKYDIAYMPHRSFRSGAIAFWGGIPERIGFCKGGGKLFYTKKIKYRYNIHEIDRNFDLLGDKYQYIREFSYRNTDFIKDKDIKLPEDFIVISPGAKWATKRWPFERFGELGRKIINNYGIFVVITGEKSEEEICKKTEDIINIKDRVLNMCGRTSLSDLMFIISKARVVIANDSANVHIASSLNVPSICVMGPTVKEFGFYPLYSDSIVCETDLYCRPCSPHGPNKCPGKHFKCMKSITPDYVYTQFEELINKKEK